ncbi:aspartate racemase [Saccharopolyspora erythraea NRRL 2338]|uniref:Aspartate racemase n=2 Tax=Saccharopolyspora erythraea TaxID=1836 RepID=A4FJV3_SACEN|nr:amino acid racemase [Saccharopolyspora erythraea]EQD82857.1 aspartate racemase [Saccharopolyspora erythraea D]PFG97969.1 aspartate racemase [Saccharopolyspora erythraea NRRL 2338]QRK88094.1 amino acid racemase [Saccharopolyspora erythraea]CAM04328.1 aspartate racemase [Saccharopolyspora erythraea NRRL 2338]
MSDTVFDLPSSRAADYPGALGPTIGVLGGMGPAATADFYAKLIRATPATTDQEHLRVIIWSDPTTPDRTRALLEGGTDPTPWLVYGARVLAAGGADVIAVPCNTAHAFLPAVVERVGVPLVHMIEQTSRHLAALRPPVRKVGLLATTGTVRARLYETWLATAGIALLVPDSTSQAEEVMAAIRSIKAGKDDRGLLARAARRLVDRDARAIIAGCTEIPLGLETGQLPVPVVDPTQVLAEAVIAHARGGGLN